MLDLNYTLLIQLLIFVVVMICLNLLLFRPLGRLHERREQTFLRLEHDVDTLELEKNRKIAEYQQRLDEEKKQLLEYRSSLRETLDHEKGVILGEAREEAEQILQKETEELHAELVAVRQALDSQARDFAAAIFAKLMGRTVGARQ